MTTERETGTVPGMRHVWSLLAGIVIAPLAWILVSVGQVEAGREFASAATGGAITARHLVEPAIFLAAAGLVVGLVASLRVSPLGPLVAGLAYIAGDIGLLVDPSRTYNLFAYTVTIPGLATKGDMSLPLTSGLSLVVGVLLLVAVAAPGRWRAWPRPVPTGVAGGPGTGTDPDLADTAVQPLTPAEPSWLDSQDSVATLAQPEVGPLPTRRPTDPPPQMSGAPTVASPRTWSETDLADAATDPLPQRGKSPWDTPLREGTAGAGDR